MQNYWMVRAGVNQANIEDFLQNSFVGLGWNEVGRYTRFAKVEDIKDAIRVAYPSNNNVIGNWAYIIFRFSQEMQKGDRVVSYYSKYRVFLIGEVESDCLFDENRRENNYRVVKWIGFVYKDELEKSTRNSLGSIASFYYLTHIKEDLEKHLIKGLDFSKKIAEVEPEKIITKIKERDLHPYLAKYLMESLRVRSKTIYHERSDRKMKGLNEWLHPDMVGVEFSFDKYNESIGEIQREMQSTRAILYSFELKLSLTLSNLREYYFQAVSNSSWANFAYLVVGQMQESEEVGIELKKELIRLNNLFGVGVIQINIENTELSKIVVPAKEKNDIDWDTIDIMKSVNSDFDNYLNLIKDCLKINKSDQKGWDEIEIR